jgi:hypothetical protein
MSCISTPNELLTGMIDISWLMHNWCEIWCDNELNMVLLCLLLCPACHMEVLGYLFESLTEVGKKTVFDQENHSHLYQKYLCRHYLYILFNGMTCCIDADSTCIFCGFVLFNCTGTSRYTFWPQKRIAGNLTI